MSQGARALWGGRFSGGTSSLMQRFSQSVSFDWRLYRHDIAGSVAHAIMLSEVGLITSEERQAITDGLREIEEEIEAGKFSWSLEREDVHMNIEAALTARVPAGAKLHTGRSRNDQVATDLRLWFKEEVVRERAALRALQQALVGWARRDLNVILPGYTHLQRAQPVSLAHHLLAYVEMLERDAGRLADAARRADVLPLGSGALAGSTLPLNRQRVAELLGFATVSENSMDAVADRDFAVEYAAAAALVAVHLSRLAEDLILWTSAEFGFIELPEAYTTGSSIMPQKKNPDAAELVRGKSGRIIGNLVSLLTLLKGLPMSYNRDLQEDKERLFDTADTLHDSLEVFTAMIAETHARPEACRGAAADPLLLATDVAEWLVRQGMPFRQAHHVVGAAVGQAEKRGVSLAKLPLEVWQELSPLCNEEMLGLLKLDGALSRRVTAGSPAPAQVTEAVIRWEEKLKN